MSDKPSNFYFHGPYRGGVLLLQLSVVDAPFDEQTIQRAVTMLSMIEVESPDDSELDDDVSCDRCEIDLADGLLIAQCDDCKQKDAERSADRGTE